METIAGEHTSIALAARPPRELLPDDKITLLEVPGLLRRNIRERSLGSMGTLAQELL
jgi:hypothetical protein